MLFNKGECLCFMHSPLLSGWPEVRGEEIEQTRWKLLRVKGWVEQETKVDKTRLRHLWFNLVGLLPLK